MHSYTSPEGRKGYLLEYDSQPSEAPQLLAMLKRYVLRAKVKLRDVSEEYSVWAAWGSENEQVWETERQWDYSRSGAVEPVWIEEAPWGTNTGPLRDRRGVGMGSRVIARKGDRRKSRRTLPESVARLFTLSAGLLCIRYCHDR